MAFGKAYLEPKPTVMKFKGLLIIALFFGLAFSAIAQQGKAHGHNQRKNHHKKEVVHYSNMKSGHFDHYHKIAKKEKEYYKKLRKSHLKHLEYCHACNHSFYHNEDYYYMDDVYYSRVSRTPVWFDAELFFRNGSIRVTL